MRRERVEALRPLAAGADALGVAGARRRRLEAAHGGAGAGAPATRGATVLTCWTGLRSPSETSATITGVIAVAMIVPCSQNNGTTVAATTAAAAEMPRVWSERPLPLFCSG